MPRWRGPGRRSPPSRSPGQRTTCRSSPNCWTTRSSSAATTTPESSGGCGDLVISIREVGPRDGLQNEAPVPTTAKVELLDALSTTGVRRIEAVSFVHPKAIPQMADAAEVWAAARPVPGVRYSALVPNTRGAQRALAAGFTELEVVVSASDAHNQANLNRSTAESLDDIAGLIDLVHGAGGTVEVIVATSFGCPYTGDVAPSAVRRIVQRGTADGADRLAFRDTPRHGPPPPVREVLGVVPLGRPAGLPFPQTPGAPLGRHPTH